jgi:hypothetical protein
MVRSAQNSNLDANDAIFGGTMEVLDESIWKSFRQAAKLQYNNGELYCDFGRGSRWRTIVRHLGMLFS